MPTYDYRCKSCGHEFEELQSMTENALTVCPKCAEPTLRRAMGSGAGVIFKGSGFYLTDYRKSNSAPSTSKPTDSSSSDKPKSDPPAPKPSTDKNE
jgi:putative FmdB family regulatory protein